MSRELDENMSEPLISVVMPVYNAEKYVGDAIESILNQTFRNFEFIVINDGSSDKSLDIIKKYQKIDDRIILRDRENKGLVFSLNEGISIAQGKYIARMDADDISLPTRFEEQIKYMDIRKIDVCGSNVQLFNEERLIKVWRYPSNDNGIKFLLMFMSAFAHPSVIFKKEVFLKLKYENYKHAEDYKLWTDVALSNYKMGNIDKILLFYRYHKDQVSQKSNFEQRRMTIEISQSYIKDLGEIVILNNLMKNCNEATVYGLSRLYNDIDTYRKKLNVSDECFLNVARHILKISSPNSLKLFWIYRSITKDIKKDIKTDLYLFLQSFFCLSRDSNLYQFLKRFA